MNAKENKSTRKKTKKTKEVEVTGLSQEDKTFLDAVDKHLYDSSKYFKEHEVLSSQGTPSFPLKNLTVENFKSVSSQNIEFKPLTLVVGANSSGKSTLIQAISVIAQVTEMDTQAAQIRLNGDLIELGTWREVLNHKVGGEKREPADMRRFFKRQADFADLEEKIDKIEQLDSEIQDAESRLENYASDYLAFDGETGEPLDGWIGNEEEQNEHEIFFEGLREHYERLCREREETVQLSLKLSTKHIRGLNRDFEKESLLEESLNPEKGKIGIGGTLFFENQRIRGVEESVEGPEGNMLVRPARGDFGFQFKIDLIEGADQQGQVFRTDCRFYQSKSNTYEDVVPERFISKEVHLVLETTGRVGEEIGIPDRPANRNARPLLAGFSRKNQSDIAEVIGGIEIREYSGPHPEYPSPGRTVEVDFSSQGNYLADYEVLEGDQLFDGFFIKGSGFDGVFPNTVWCKINGDLRVEEAIDELISFLSSFEDRERYQHVEGRIRYGNDEIPYDDEYDPVSDLGASLDSGVIEEHELDRLQEGLYHAIQILMNWDSNAWSRGLETGYEREQRKGNLPDKVRGQLAKRFEDMAFSLERMGKKNFRKALLQRTEHKQNVEAKLPTWELLSSVVDRYSHELFEDNLRKAKRLFSSVGIRYLGPLREVEPHPGVNEDAIGKAGEYAAHVLHKKSNVKGRYLIPLDFKGISNPPMKSMFLESNDTTLGSALDLWLEWFGFGLTLSTTDQNRHGLGVDVTTVEGQESVNLTMVGVGVSQAYPVILQCLLSKPGDLLLFEQPELHLHPALQKKMGEFLLYFAQHDRQIIAETHSEHVINQIRASAAMDADNKIPQYVQLLFAEKIDGETQYTPSEVNKYGGLNQEWPDGFLDEGPKLSEQLLREALKKRKQELATEENPKND